MTNGDIYKVPLELYLTKKVKCSLYSIVSYGKLFRIFLGYLYWFEYLVRISFKYTCTKIYIIRNYANREDDNAEK